MTTEAADKTASETIDFLSYRLRRIEFLLTGSDEAPEQLQKESARGRDHGLQARLANLEQDLATLASKSTKMHELLKLYAAQPDVFQSTNSDGLPTASSTPEILAIISSSAPVYPTTASRLTSIKDLPIPSAESSAALIALLPRLKRLEILQESQDQELAQLRLRSASAMKRWYELGPLGGSECWTEWESRMTNIERLVRREEGQQAREIEAREAYKV